MSVCGTRPGHAIPRRSDPRAGVAAYPKPEGTRHALGGDRSTSVESPGGDDKTEQEHVIPAAVYEHCRDPSSQSQRWPSVAQASVTSTRASAPVTRPASCALGQPRELAGPRLRRRRGRCLWFWDPGHSIVNQAADVQIRAGGERDRNRRVQSRLRTRGCVEADADPLERRVRIILHAARRDGEGECQVRQQYVRGVAQPDVAIVGAASRAHNKQATVLETSDAQQSRPRQGVRSGLAAPARLASAPASPEPASWCSWTRSGPRQHPRAVALRRPG